MAVVPHANSALDLADRVEVAYAFSPSAARRAKFAEKFPFPQCERLETILEDRSIDAVAVLTPPATHLDLARRCAEAGKHVLLEKPLEITTARAEEMVDVCRRKGVKLGVVLQHRHKPATERLATLLHAGELGIPVGASAIIRLAPAGLLRRARPRHPGARRRRRADPTSNPYPRRAAVTGRGCRRRQRLCSHDSGHRMECEDLVCATVRWKSGALGVIEATTAAYPGAAERIEPTGTRGTATLAGTALEVRWHDGRTESLAPDGSGGGTGADPMAFPHDYHRSVWRDFLDAVQGGGEPRVNGEEALRVHRLIDSLLASAAARKPVQTT